jgi:N-sulfoglucosamine sulfohydrolase
MRDVGSGDVLEGGAQIMPGDKMNVVVVICHDLGQHVGCYGVPEARTPNLDRFAAREIRFSNHFCCAPQCSPSRAALWTGRYPHANGVVGLSHSGFQNEYHDDERHLAQILDGAGYETHLFGLQHVSARPERCGFKTIHGLAPCGQVAERAGQFLEERKGTGPPLYVQVGFFEAHRPFLHPDVERLDPAQVTVPPYLPDIPEVREDLAGLEASISSADKAFGKIVEAVDRSGMGDNTIVIFTVDHGIPFTRAKMTLYDPGIETALLMRIPGVEGRKVYDEMVSNVDVLPTLLDLLGLDRRENLHGRSFEPLIAGEDYEPNQAIFAEKTYHTYYDPMRCIRTERWKLVANFEFAPWQDTSPDFDDNAKSYYEAAKALAVPYDRQYHPPLELYDLENDPWEQRDLADSPDHREIRDGLIRQLRQWMRDTADPLLEGPMAQGAYRNRMAEFLRI